MLRMMLIQQLCFLNLFIPKGMEQVISQTTSLYPVKQTEITQEEMALPGKLPETPLRMDPDLLYDIRYDEDFDDRAYSPNDQIQMETPPKEPLSSYSVSPA